MGSLSFLLFPQSTSYWNILSPVFLSKKKKIIFTKYIHTHVLCLLNIQILFNMLFTSQHWFPACSLSLAVSSSALNNFKSLLPRNLFSPQFPFLSFFHFNFFFLLSCGRNQATISSSDIALHLHNLNKFLTNLYIDLKKTYNLIDLVLHDLHVLMST